MTQFSPFLTEFCLLTKFSRISVHFDRILPVFYQFQQNFRPSLTEFCLFLTKFSPFLTFFRLFNLYLFFIFQITLLLVESNQFGKNFVLMVEFSLFPTSIFNVLFLAEIRLLLTDFSLFVEFFLFIFFEWSNILNGAGLNF